MRIINMDAPKERAELFNTKKIPTFVRSFLRPLEKKYYPNFKVYQDISTRCPVSHVRQFECGWYENIAVLWHTIPIYLRKECPDYLRRMYKVQYDEQYVQYNEQYECTIDLLGAYFPIRTGDGPYIELYLENIYETILKDIDRDYPTLHATLKRSKEPEYFKNLVTIVLLHELAHAALDIFNLEDTPKSEKVSYSTPFGFWREESMANAVALRIIRDKAELVQDRENGEIYINPNGNELTNNTIIYDYAKKFMELQPAAYKLGVKMEEFECKDFRSVFYAKTNGVNMDLQKEWLEYAKGDPNWAGLQKWNVRLDSQYVYLFEGKYYSSEQELVYDIVNKTLSDYESKNGSKMSSSTFTSIFPYIRTGIGMSYEPTRTVEENSRYEKVIQLDDGNYSLYNFWDNVSLHRFIDTEKLGIDIKEYKNY